LRWTFFRLPAIAPLVTIMINAGLKNTTVQTKKDTGENAIVVKKTEMIKAGIIEPVLVMKSALKNTVSVVKNNISADCVISNMRMNESNQ